MVGILSTASALSKKIGLAKLEPALEVVYTHTDALRQDAGGVGDGTNFFASVSEKDKASFKQLLTLAPVFLENKQVGKMKPDILSLGQALSSGIVARMYGRIPISTLATRHSNQSV